MVARNGDSISGTALIRKASPEFCEYVGSRNTGAARQSRARVSGGAEQRRVAGAGAGWAVVGSSGSPGPVCPVSPRPPHCPHHQQDAAAFWDDPHTHRRVQLEK